MDTLEGIKNAGFVQIEPDTLHRIVILTKEQRDWTTSEIERLRKEKEWLIRQYLSQIGRGSYKTELERIMQQALKEGK